MIPIASGLIMLHYFDHNATTPLLPPARAAWLQAADENWMNPSSPYRHAAAVRVRLEAAREALADRFGANRDRLIFTSGATESNNAVFAHVARRCPYGKVAVCATEHPSVIEAARFHFEVIMNLIGTFVLEWLGKDLGRMYVYLIKNLPLKLGNMLVGGCVLISPLILGMNLWMYLIGICGCCLMEGYYKKAKIDGITKSSLIMFMPVLSGLL